LLNPEVNAGVNEGVSALLAPGAYRRGGWLAFYAATQNGHTLQFEAFARSDDVEIM